MFFTPEWFPQRIIRPRWYGGAAIAAPQLLLPASDVSSGRWLPSSGSSLAATIDEPGGPNDADYDYCLDPGETFEVALAAGSDPAVDTGHVVRYRARSPQGRQITVSLYQSTTLIASWTDTLVSEMRSYDHALTNPQAASITDYSALRLRFFGVRPT